MICQALQAEVNLHQAEIVAVGVLGHSIEGLIRGPEFERGKSINQRYDELCANIAVYQAKLQSALTTSQNFKDGLDAAIKALTDLKKQLDKLPPVSRNLVELRNQAQQFKVLLNHALISAMTNELCFQRSKTVLYFFQQKEVCESVGPSTRHFPRGAILIFGFCFAVRKTNYTRVLYCTISKLVLALVALTGTLW